MDAVVNFISSWPVLVQRAFTEHALAVAFVTVAAVAAFVVLQQEWRPDSLISNIAFVAGGWLIAVSSLVYVMALARKGWIVLERGMPFAAKLSAYIYGICERHPILALALAGIGTLVFLVRRGWPMVVRWTPVRALCTVLGIALAIHVAGPIADMVDGGEPVLGPQLLGRLAQEPVGVPLGVVEHGEAQAVQLRGPARDRPGRRGHDAPRIVDRHAPGRWGMAHGLALLGLRGGRRRRRRPAP